jgi:hypothetical protein
MRGDMSPVIIIIAIALAVELAFIAAAVINRRRLLELVKHQKFGAILLSLILALQVFQYGRWFIFHDNALYTASKELGRNLPENAVIAGSWSAGLVVENRLKALILQSLIPYNHNLVNKIVHDIPIPVNRLNGGKKAAGPRNDIPLYLAVCRNVIFEKTIVEIYSDHLVPENRIGQYRFGLFRIEIFKMKKYREKTADVVNSLFKSFL